jgi:Cdc6-like AAA superfamily ATPase
VNYLPVLSALRQDGIGVTAAKYLLFIVLAIPLSPVWLFGSAFVHSRLKGQRFRANVIWFILGALGVVWIGVAWSWWSSLYATFWAEKSAAAYASLAFAWLAALPTIATGGIAMSGLDWLVDKLAPKTFEEEVEAALRQQERVAQLQAAYASKVSQNVPHHDKLLVLGAYDGGVTFDGKNGIHIFKSFIALEDSLLNEHMFVLGATGAGKTETIKRLLWEVLYKTQRRVLLIDGKGDEQLAYDLRAMAHHFGRGETPIFRLGKKITGAAYDGFRGTSEALCDRLCAMIGVTEAEGDSEHYANIYRDILQLICFAPKGAPRSFTELQERISLDWLIETYVNHPVEGAVVQDLDKDDVKELARKFRPLWRVFKDIITPEGFAIEDAKCAVFSIRTQSALDSSKRFLKFFIDDIRDFIGNRQTEPGIMIIDEFASFGNETIVNLLSLARSAGLSIVLATQDISMLGDELLQKKITSNTRTMILMNTTYPELIAMLAGTHFQVEASVQMVEGQPSGVTSGRVQHTFNVTPNSVRSLQAGAAFVIRNNAAAKVQVSRVTDIPEAPPEPEPQQRKAQVEEPESRPIHKL